MIHLLALVRRAFEADRRMAGFFIQLLRLLDPAPSAPIGFLQNLRDLVQSRVAACETADAESEDGRGWGWLAHGRLRARLASFQFQVLLESSKKRSKGLFLSFSAWMTHLWCIRGGNSGTDTAEANFGLEAVDFSFNPSGGVISNEGVGVCQIVKCNDVLVHYEEGADECVMKLILNGGADKSQDRGGESRNQRVRVSVGSQEVLAAAEFALMVHFLVDQGSDLLSVPVDIPAVLPSTPQGMTTRDGTASAHNSFAPSDLPARGMGRARRSWKVMRHTIEVQGIEVVFLNDLSSARFDVFAADAAAASVRLLRVAQLPKLSCQNFVA